MLVLVIDVRDHLLRLRCADRKRAISLLPCKIVSNRVVHPLRRAPLQQLHCLCKRHGAGQNYQGMQMIRRPAGSKDRNAMIASDGCEISPKSRLQIGWDLVRAGLCAEYDMNTVARI